MDTSVVAQARCVAVSLRHAQARCGSEAAALRRYLAPLHAADCVVYAKRPFAGPAQVLEYVGRYTHRVAIANSRLVSITDSEVAFRWRDYRRHGKAKPNAP